jgi:hypothetical protein
MQEHGVEDSQGKVAEGAYFYMESRPHQWHSFQRPWKLLDLTRTQQPDTFFLPFFPAFFSGMVD